jgi:hypothetical protein
MTIDAKDVALAGAAVGGILLISARADAGGRKRRRRRKGGGGSGGGATPGPAGVIPVPVPADGGGNSPINVPGGGDSGGGPSVSVPDDVLRARTAIDAARGTGQAAEAVLDTGSGGVDFFADAIGGDAPGAFSKSGGVTGASYEAGQLTGNVIDAVAPTDESGAGRDPLGIGNSIDKALNEGPF